MRFFVLFTLVYFSIMAPNATAATARNLHNVQVPVEDQTEQSRTDALGGAFQKVLIKVSGTQAVLENPLLMEEQANAQSYISSLRYDRDENDQLLLSITFMPGPLQALLERADAPIWGASRPLTQLWLASSTGRERSVVNRDNDTWHRIVFEAMNDRGLPVIFPNWDLEDEMALPVASLWGLFEQDIERAVDRYASDGYLAGRILQSGDLYSFNGYVTYGDRREDLEVSATTEALLAADIAGRIAEGLSDRYAVVALKGVDNGYVLRVNGVQAFSDYRKLLDYLDAHVGVREVRLMRSEGTTLTLSLVLTSNWQQVWDVLSLDQKLIGTATPGLYTWNP